MEKNESSNLENVVQLAKYLCYLENTHKDLLKELGTNFPEILSQHRNGLELIDEALNLLKDIGPILQKKYDKRSETAFDKEKIINQHRAEREPEYQKYIQDPFLEYSIQDDHHFRERFYKKKCERILKDLDLDVYQYEHLIKRVSNDQTRVTDIGNMHLIAYRELGNNYNKEIFDIIFNMGHLTRDTHKKHQQERGSFFMFFGEEQKQAESPQDHNTNTMMQIYEELYKSNFTKEIHISINHHLQQKEYEKAKGLIKTLFPHTKQMADYLFQIVTQQKIDNDPDREITLQECIKTTMIGQASPVATWLIFGNRSEESLKKEQKRETQEKDLSYIEFIKKIKEIDPEKGQELLEKIHQNIQMPNYTTNGNSLIKEISQIWELQYLCNNPEYLQTLEKASEEVEKNPHISHYFLLAEYIHKCNLPREEIVKKGEEKFQNSPVHTLGREAYEEMEEFISSKIRLYQNISYTREQMCEKLQELLQEIDRFTGKMARYAATENIGAESEDDDSKRTHRYMSSYEFDDERRNHIASYEIHQMYLPIIKEYYRLQEISAAQKIEEQIQRTVKDEERMYDMESEITYGIKAREDLWSIDDKNIQANIQELLMREKRFDEETNVSHAEYMYQDLAMLKFKIGLYFLKKNQRTLWSHYDHFLKSIGNNHKMLE